MMRRGTILTLLPAILVAFFVFTAQAKEPTSHENARASGPGDRVVKTIPRLGDIFSQIAGKETAKEWSFWRKLSDADRARFVKEFNRFTLRIEDSIEAKDASANQSPTYKFAHDKAPEASVERAVPETADNASSKGELRITESFTCRVSSVTTTNTTPANDRKSFVVSLTWSATPKNGIPLGDDGFATEISWMFVTTVEARPQE